MHWLLINTYLSFFFILGFTACGDDTPNTLLQKDVLSFFRVMSFNIHAGRNLSGEFNLDEVTNVSGYPYEMNSVLIVEYSQLVIYFTLGVGNLKNQSFMWPCAY